nr:39S ribosomal protein L55, mitochondrial-like [Oryctolagus cuniculus]
MADGYQPALPAQHHHVCVQPAVADCHKDGCPQAPLPARVPLVGSQQQSLSHWPTRAPLPLYRVLLVKQDGSTIHICCREPRCMLVMPLDLDTLSAKQRRAWLHKLGAQLPPKEEDSELADDFDTEHYRWVWNRK